MRRLDSGRAITRKIRQGPQVEAATPDFDDKELGEVQVPHELGVALPFRATAGGLAPGDSRPAARRVKRWPIIRQ